jgi:hypothetical protein
MTSITRKILCASGVLCFAALSASGAIADEIVLENGDVITGKVTKLEKGVVTVTTAYSERAGQHTGLEDIEDNHG